MILPRRAVHVLMVAATIVGIVLGANLFRVIAGG